MPRGGFLGKRLGSEKGFDQLRPRFGGDGFVGASPAAAIPLFDFRGLG